MSEKIKHYYSERVKNDKRDNFLWQVGKTVNGEEVPSEQIEIIINTIASRLKLDKIDNTLDIGCGNGLLTNKISEYVSDITGIELTRELYEIAEEYNSSDNISYANCNVLDFEVMGHGKFFSKVYLYEVIQHLNYREVDLLFSKLTGITTDDPMIFIGGILDVEKKWVFFDTVERRYMYFDGLLSENDPLGTWYHRDFFTCLAKKHNLNVECFDQDRNLYTSHYRFDCVLRKI